MASPFTSVVTPLPFDLRVPVSVEKCTTTPAEGRLSLVRTVAWIFDVPLVPLPMLMVAGLAVTTIVESLAAVGSLFSQPAKAATTAIRMSTAIVFRGFMRPPLFFHQSTRGSPPGSPLAERRAVQAVACGPALDVLDPRGSIGGR